MLFLFFLSLIGLAVSLAAPLITRGASLEETWPFASLSLLILVTTGRQMIRRRRDSQTSARKRGTVLFSLGAILLLAGVTVSVGSAVLTKQTQEKLARDEAKLSQLKGDAAVRSKQIEDEIYYAEARVEDAQSLLPLMYGALAGGGSFAVIGFLMMIMGFRRRSR